MKCSGCGKEIPFHGQVCPYCQRDKAGDQGATVLVGFGLITGGGLGYLVAGFTGMMVGGFICGIITAVIGATNAQNAAKTPPKVQAHIVSPTPSKPAASANPKIKERLAVLETLREDGLISAEEYREKRKAILDAV